MFRVQKFPHMCVLIELSVWLTVCCLDISCIISSSMVWISDCTFVFIGGPVCLLVVPYKGMTCRIPYAWQSFNIQEDRLQKLLAYSTELLLRLKSQAWALEEKLEMRHPDLRPTSSSAGRLTEHVIRILGSTMRKACTPP